MPSSNIIRLEPNGPRGELEHRAFPMELLAFGQAPIQRGYRYLEDTEHGVFMSVWDSTPVTLKFHTFPRYEFFRVLDGSVTIIDAAGRESTFRAGDCFIFPQGLKSQWKQSEYFRKYAVGFTDASAKDPADPTILAVVRLDPDGPLDEAANRHAEEFLGPVPPQHDCQWFADPTGQLTARVWDSTACHSKPRSAPCQEWMRILAGSVTLTDAAGTAHRFTAGDSYVVPLGTVYSWRCHAYLRTIRCTFEPRTSAARAEAAEQQPNGSEAGRRGFQPK
jgi:uncharacterized cupin superfamily protein